jgi:hypothetical protein
MAFSNGSITVLQDNKPLQDATVVIGDQQSITDGSGIARFSSLPEGKQDIVIKKEPNRFVVQTSIQSDTLSVSVSESAVPSAKPGIVQPGPVQLLNLGEQSITILGIVLLVLLSLGGFVFIIFFRRNILAYQRQLKQLGMLAVLGAVAGVSALIYSQTSMLSSKTQAKTFTQSTRADTRKEIPVPTNIQNTITENALEFKWEIQQKDQALVIVNGYLVEWVVQSQLENKDETKNMVVKEPAAILPNLEKGQIYVVRISTIDAEGNFSEPAEFITLFP